MIRMYLRGYLGLPIKSDFSMNLQYKHGHQGNSLEDLLTNRRKNLYNLVLINPTI